MALNSFQLFLSQMQTVPEVLKLRMLQVVFDVFMVHEGEFLANASAKGCRDCRKDCGSFFLETPRRGGLSKYVISAISIFGRCIILYGLIRLHNLRLDHQIDVQCVCETMQNENKPIDHILTTLTHLYTMGL
jgi:hypothetical protein